MSTNRLLPVLSNTGGAMEVYNRREITIFGTGGKIQKAMLAEMQITPPENAIFIVGNKADVTSDFYDVMGREVGVSFGGLKVKSDDKYKATVELQAHYYNKVGSPVVDVCEYEIDVYTLYQYSRLEWKPDTWQTGKRKDGTEYSFKAVDEKRLAALQAQGFLLDEIVYNEDMVPINIKRKLPPDVEKELYINFQTLIKNKIQKAQTCCRRTLIKRALGLKGVPIPEMTKEEKASGEWKKDVKFSIYNVQPQMGMEAAVEAVCDIFDDDHPAQADGVKDEIPTEIMEEPEEGVQTPSSSPVSHATSPVTPSKMASPTSTPPAQAPASPAPAKAKFTPVDCMLCGNSITNKNHIYYSEKDFGKGKYYCYGCQKTLKANPIENQDISPELQDQSDNGMDNVRQEDLPF